MDTNDIIEDKTIKSESEKYSGIVCVYIGENYSPLGASEEKEYITSAEIRKRLLNMADVDITFISALMKRGGFRSETIAGIQHWVIYNKKKR